jgi:AcrR family transcriptional regulator
MEAVARAAGITKRTLYARYPDKDALFADVMVWALMLYHSTDLPQKIEEWDLVEGLLELGRSILARARDPDVMRVNRLAFMEAFRIPDFSTKAYSTMWSPRVRALANLLEMHKKAGNIVVEDVEMAAEQFLAMVGQAPMWLAALGQARPPKMDERYLKHAVALFLRSIQPRHLHSERRKKVRRRVAPPASAFHRSNRRL